MFLFSNNVRFFNIFILYTKVFYVAKMNKHLITEFQQLGVDERTSVLASQVYLELCEVKKYWSPVYEYNPNLEKIVIRAKRKPTEEFSVFLPVASYKQLSFQKLQQFLTKCCSESIFLAIVHPDSTCVYYEISKDLLKPTETTAKHLRVNKQEKLDSDLRKHRETIQQAALFGIPITIAKTEKPKPPKNPAEEESVVKIK